MRIRRKTRALAIRHARGAMDKLAPNEKQYVARNCWDLRLLTPCVPQGRQVCPCELVVATAVGADVHRVGAWPEDKAGLGECNDHL